MLTFLPDKIMTSIICRRTVVLAVKTGLCSFHRMLNTSAETSLMLANICFTEKDKRKARNTGAFSTLTWAGYSHTGNRQQRSFM